MTRMDQSGASSVMSQTYFLNDVIDVIGLGERIRKKEGSNVNQDDI